MVVSSTLLFLTLALLADSIPVELDTVLRKSEENWQLVPDRNWELHMVDVNNYVDIEPYFNAVTQTIFRLYTKRNPDNEQIISLNNQDELNASNYNRNLPTRFIIHGWNNDARSDVNVYVRNAYLQQGDFNIFVVDWGKGANTINYISARNRVNTVSSVLFSFLQFLNGNGLSNSRVTLVGHSLGAHIAGLTGKKFLTNRIASIIALDPALPLFSMDKPGDRIHANDADYVESIQTDTGRLGMSQPVGQVAFYPNYGGSHPGCGLDLTGTCAHSRSWEFFSESINSELGFWGIPCRNYIDIVDKLCISIGPNRTMGGEPLNRPAQGVYYFRTNNRAPFSQGPGQR